MSAPSPTEPQFLWTIPTQGDGRSPQSSHWGRGSWRPDQQRAFAASVRDERPGAFNTGDYVTQVARAAEAAGFTGLFIPYDPAGEESFVLASALARETPRLTIVPEITPAFATAVYAAKLALSFQRFFDDRLGWKVALDGDVDGERAVGDFLPADERLARAEEFLVTTKGVWHDAPFTFEGSYFQVEAGGFFLADASVPGVGSRGTARRAAPVVYLDGEDDAAIELSARFGDVHLFRTADPDVLPALVERLRSRAAAHGRSVRAGLRLGVIAREFPHEAWRKASRLWSAAHDGIEAGLDDHRGDGGLWSGFDRIGHTARWGLIGDFAEVAAGFDRYHGWGIETFVLDGLPRVEEAYRLGEYVFPRLPGRTPVLEASAS